nr:MAG TPA: hypothetical protein [Caudoviricetes sp.]
MAILLLILLALQMRIRLNYLLRLVLIPFQKLKVV